VLKPLDPYYSCLAGRLRASSGKLSAIGFAGEYTDAETGFVYLLRRSGRKVVEVSRPPR